MQKMYKKGSEPIKVHPGQIDNAIQRGWSLEKPSTTKKVKSKKEL
jgi:hypothetical protein